MLPGSRMQFRRWSDNKLSLVGKLEQVDQPGSHTVASAPPAALVSSPAPMGVPSPAPMGVLKGSE
jgi:hypothetical protein